MTGQDLTPLYEVRALRVNTRTALTVQIAHARPALYDIHVEPIVVTEIFEELARES